MKKIISFIVAIAIIIIFSSVPINAIGTIGKSTLKIRSDTDLDLSSIKIKVSSVKRTLESEKLERIEKNESFIVNASATGDVFFKKPNDQYSIEILLESLPAGYGIKRSIIYCDNRSTDPTVISLYEIDDIEPVFIYNDINIRFKNKNGDYLHTNYKITENPIKTSQSTSLNHENDNIVALYSGKVNANGKIFDYAISKEYSVKNDLERVSTLYALGEITYDDYILSFCDIINRGPKSAFCTSDIIYQLDCLFEKSQDNSKQKELIAATRNALYYTSEKFDSVVSINYPCNNVSNCSSNGSHIISVFYDSSETTNLKARKVAYEARKVLSFYSVEGFNCPNRLNTSPTHVDITTNYQPCICIVLSNEFTGLGLTFTEIPNTEGFVMVSENILYSDIYKTVLAHELFHLIQKTYLLTNDNDIWIKESSANLGAALYADSIGELTSHLYEWKDGVKDYYQTAEYNLTKKISGNYRHYSIVFPLILHQMLGGASALSDIFNEIKLMRQMISANNYSNQEILAAIDSVASSYSSTYNLRTILEQFGYNNFLGYRSYNLLSSASWGNSTKVSLIPLAMSSSSACSIDELGYAYFKLSSSPQTVPLRIITASTEPTASTVYIIESMSGNVLSSTKYTMTGSTLNLNYSFASSATDLIIIVECTSTIYGAYSIVYVN